MKNEKIKASEAISILTILSITNIILSSSKYVLRDCNSASLINSIYITTIAIIITSIFCLLLKNFSNKNLLAITESLGGKALKTVIGLLFVGYFILRASVLLKKLCVCLQTIYYPMTNIIFIVALFCIATGLILNLKNNSVFKSTVAIIPLLFISIILVFMGNTKNFNFENIYPILGNGINSTFVTGLSNLWLFNNIAYLWFLPSNLKKPQSFTKIAMLSTLFTGIFLFITIANILFLFSNTLDNSALFPLYLSSRYIEFGSFFQRMEPLFLFFCSLGFICTLCVNAYIIIVMIKDIFDLSNEKPLIYPYVLTTGGIALLITKLSSLEFIETTVFKILFFTLGLAIPFIITVLAILKKKILRRLYN